MMRKIKQAFRKIKELKITEINKEPLREASVLKMHKRNRMETVNL